MLPFRCFLVVFLWLPLAAQAGVYRQPGLTINYEGDRRDLAVHLGERHTIATEALAAEWGLTVPPEVAVHIFANHETAAEAGFRFPSWYAGVAYWPQPVIVMNASAASTRGAIAFDGVYYHEVAHLALKYPPTGSIGALPRWLDEGLAMHIAGAWDLADGWERLSRPLSPNAAYSLRDLAGTFPPSRGAMAQAYAQSYQVTGYLLQAHGREIVPEMLGLMQEGVPFLGAFYQVTGLTITEFESAWLQSLDTWSGRLLGLLGANAVWAAMGGLGLAAVLVNYRRRKAKQAYLEWQDLMEEGLAEDETIH